MFSENDLHKLIEQQDRERKCELRRAIQKRLEAIQKETDKSPANEARLQSENQQGNK